MPVLAIAAQIPSTEIGLGYFQETHPQELFRECSHYVELVTNASQFPRVLERAMRAAIGEHGVAVIVLPGDVALSAAPARTPSWFDFASPVTTPADADLERLAALLDGSDAVTLLCGSGCAGAHDEVVALADALAAPVVHALRGKQHIEYDNPNSVGMTGLIGFSSGYHAMQSCDTLLMLGTDFPIAISIRRAPGSRRSTAARRRSAVARRSASASSATCAPRCPRCCRASGARRGAVSSSVRLRIMPPRARGSTNWRDRRRPGGRFIRST